MLRSVSYSDITFLVR